MKVRVLIADDSSIFREVLRDALEKERDIEVIGEAKDGEEGVRLAAALNPDLVTVDIQMPRQGGLTTIEQIMASRPRPILVLTSQPTGPGSDLVYQAVERGALEILDKKVVTQGQGAALRTLARRLATIRVVRHVSRRHSGPLTPMPVAEMPASSVSGIERRRVVAIGASAGGPAAVATILSQLDAGFPACIALVQHIPVGFIESFSQFLQGLTRLKVKIVTERTEPKAGMVLLPPDDGHLIALPMGLFAPGHDPPVRGYRPSATALFSTVAQAFAHEAVGVVLTGMGDDGATGARIMRESGALMIAQNEETCAVYGMPKAAVEAGAIERILPLGSIPGALIEATAALRPASWRKEQKT